MFIKPKAQKYTPREIPRLFGGWDVDGDQYRNLGMTVGLPPNLFIQNPHPDVELISQQIEDYATDDLSGAGTSMTDLLNSLWMRQILFHNLPKSFDEAKIKTYITSLIKDFPEYHEDCITEIHIMKLHDRQKKIVLCTFTSDTLAFAVLRTFDRMKVEGNFVNLTHFHQYIEMIPIYGEFSRSTMRNVISRINTEEELNHILEQNNSMIKDYRDLKNGYYVFLFSSKEESFEFLNFLKGIHPECAIHRLPGPNDTSHSYDFLERGTVTVFKNPQCNIHDMYQKDVLTKVIEADVLPHTEFKCIRFYNVFDELILRDKKIISQIVEDFKKGLAIYGEVTKLEFPQPLKLYGLYTYITAEFSFPDQAIKAQKELSGRYFLGRPLITQLVKEM